MIRLGAQCLIRASSAALSAGSDEAFEVGLFKLCCPLLGWAWHHGILWAIWHLLVGAQDSGHPSVFFPVSGVV